MKRILYYLPKMILISLLCSFCVTFPFTVMGLGAIAFKEWIIMYINASLMVAIPFFIISPLFIHDMKKLGEIK